MKQLTWIPAALILLFAVHPLHAEEKGAPETRYAAAVKAFPAPSVRHDFSFAGDVFREGKAVGRFKTSVKAIAPKTEGSEALWRLRFAYNVGPDKQASEALVTRTLQPVRGERSWTIDGELSKWVWERRGKRIHVVHTSGSTKPMSRSADVLEPSLVTFASILLFARLAPDTSATYATVRLDPTWNLLLGQRPYVPTAIQVTAPPKPGMPLQILAGNGAQRMTIEVDRRMRLPLWFRLTPRKGPLLQFGGTPPEPEAKKEAPAAGPVFTESAKTPRDAALRAAYAFATADRDVLDDVMHWPGLRERLGAKVPKRVSAEAFRKGMLGQLIATIRDPKKPDVVKPVLAEIAADLKTAERDGGVFRVTFPERFSTRWYDVVEVDGVWRLVGWPGN